MTIDELIENVKEWGRFHKIDNPYRQLNKVIEEVGECAHEICRDHLDTAELKDSIGDVLVTVILLSDICGQDPIKCLAGAYSEISKRKGETSKGMFIKEG